MRLRTRVLTAVLAGGAVLSGCGGGTAEPAAVDVVNDQCASCRMVVSEPRFAAQVAAPGEDARFYDDLQCLRDGLRTGTLPRGAVVFVADVRTGAWMPASRAAFARVPAMATPMGSHWVAYADEAARRADPDGARGEPLTPAAILGPGGERP